MARVISLAGRQLIEDTASTDAAVAHAYSPAPLLSDGVRVLANWRSECGGVELYFLSSGQVFSCDVHEEGGGPALCALFPDLKSVCAALFTLWETLGRDNRDPEVAEQFAQMSRDRQGLSTLYAEKVEPFLENNE